MVPIFDYLRALDEYENEVLEAVRRVLRSGRLILGPETEAFEHEFAQACGAKFCIGVNSGTDALYVSLRALGVGPGDEVITVSNTCAPTIAAIRETGAVPVFVDVHESTCMANPALIEHAIGPKTKAILPVHLWGMAFDIDAILGIANKHGIPLIEDCAQSFGTLYRGKQTGTFGATGCFSFYPTKNLGAFGDAGAIITNDESLAMRLRRMRMYGYDEHRVSVQPGVNARIGEVQAAILRIKLKYFAPDLEHRLANAEHYLAAVRNDLVSFPEILPDVRASYHQFVVLSDRRDALRAHLTANEIGNDIHYPVPVHMMPEHAPCAPKGGLPITERTCDRVLSVPVHGALTKDEVTQVTAALNSFQG